MSIVIMRFDNLCNSFEVKINWNTADARMRITRNTLLMNSCNAIQFSTYCILGSDIKGCKLFILLKVLLSN